MSTTTPLRYSNSAIAIWLAGVSFVLFQFFLQLSSGIVIGTIMQDMHLSALTAGLLSSSFYVIYTALQIPVGILFDRNNTRTLMSFNALLCSLGCLLFATSHSLIGLFSGRLLMGSGSAFAFIGLSHILRQHFPPKRFAFMIGLSETLGFVIAVAGMLGMGAVLKQYGWRGFIGTAGLIGLFIALQCWIKIPDSPKASHNHINYTKQLIDIVCNLKAWINGLFVGLCFTVVTVFGALWAIPFIQVKLQCSFAHASVLGTIFFLGAGISCPLFAILANQFPRKKLIISSCLSTTLMLLFTLFIPIHSAITMGILMFIIGICCGAYMLAYTIANEISPKDSLSTGTGFTNTLAVITAPLLQPLTGYLLDLSSSAHHHHQHTLIDYQYALLTVPIALLVATFLVLFLPDSNASS